MVDAWTGPTPRSSQTPGQPTDGIDALLRKVEAIKLELSDATNNLLKAAGISVSPAGMVIDSSLTANGDLTSTGNLNVNGSAVVAGAMESADFTATTGWQLAGSTATFNSINLRSGIVPDSALANPVTGDVGNNYVIGSVSSSWASYAVVSLTVPAGFTRALVMAVGSVIGPTTDTWQIRVNIDGLTGAEYTVFGNNGALGFSRVMTGLTSGGTLTVATDVRNAVASENNRGIATSVTVLYLK